MVEGTLKQDPMNQLVAPEWTKWIPTVSLILMMGGGYGAWGETGAAAPPPPPREGEPGSARIMGLKECLRLAVEKNRRRPASEFGVAVAEAQHRQALAGYWPQVSVKGGYQRTDQAPNFVFPAGTMAIPAQTITTPAGTANVPLPPALAALFGLPPGASLPIDVPAQTITTQPQAFPIPEQNVRLMDPDSLMASLNATWLLYDGGWRKSLRQQSAAGLEAAKQESRRTELEITDSVTRMYYGAILAKQVQKLGEDTLARMEATLNLTETMYKEGGGKVTKADFLDNKVMVETLRAMVAQLEKNQSMSQSALANTMGLSWQETIQPADAEIPYETRDGELGEMVSTAYVFSPDWARLEAGVAAAEAAVRTARSGHYPKVALTGSLYTWWNSLDTGMATSVNRDGWTVGVGVELPLFDGFLTRNRVQEAKARQDQLKEQRFLLKDGIGLLVKDTFLGLTATRKSYQATADAMKAAEENRDLNTRAYQNELVETEKVIRAQLMEAVMTAQHLKTRFDHVALESQLNLIVGTEVWKRLQGGGKP